MHIYISRKFTRTAMFFFLFLFHNVNVIIKRFDVASVTVAAIVIKPEGDLGWMQ